MVFAIRFVYSKFAQIVKLHLCYSHIVMEFYVSEIMKEIPSSFENEVEERAYSFLMKYRFPIVRVDCDEAISMDLCKIVSQKLGADIVKTLLVSNQKHTEFYLFVTLGDKRFVTKDFSKALGIARVSFASEEEFERLLGTKIGAATCYSLLLDSAKEVKLVIDEEVLKEEIHGFSDGTRTGYVAMNAKDLFQALEVETGKKAIIIKV